MNLQIIKRWCDRGLDRLGKALLVLLKLVVVLPFQRRFWVYVLIAVGLSSTEWFGRFEQVPWTQLADLLR